MLSIGYRDIRVGNALAAIPGMKKLTRKQNDALQTAQLNRIREMLQSIAITAVKAQDTLGTYDVTADALNDIFGDYQQAVDALDILYKQEWS